MCKVDKEAPKYFGLHVFVYCFRILSISFLVYFIYDRYLSHSAAQVLIILYIGGIFGIIAVLLKLRHIMNKVYNPWDNTELTWLQKICFGSLKEFATLWNGYEIHGLHKIYNQNTLLVGYHSRSNLDLMYLIANIQCNLLLSHLLFYIPMMRNILPLVGAVPAKGGVKDKAETSFISQLTESHRPLMLLPGGGVSETIRGHRESSVEGGAWFCARYSKGERDSGQSHPSGAILHEALRGLSLDHSRLVRLLRRGGAAIYAAIKGRQHPRAAVHDGHAALLPRLLPGTAARQDGHLLRQSSGPERGRVGCRLREEGVWGDAGADRPGGRTARQTVPQGPAIHDHQTVAGRLLCCSERGGAQRVCCSAIICYLSRHCHLQPAADED